MSGFVIRNATFEEIPMLLEWTANEGWNPGRHDGKPFFDQDPTGFFIGFLDNEPICSIAAVKYGSDYGFIGFYITKSEHRGKGYGIQVFNRGMEYLRGRNIGLDGAAAQQSNYVKSGFTKYYNNIRHEGHGTAGTGKLTTRVCDISSVPFDVILKYDTAHFGTERSGFVRNWIDAPENRSFCIYEDEVLKGYGCIRPAASGYRIGPLFADDKEIAEELLTALRATVSADDKIQITVSDINTAAMDLMVQHGFKGFRFNGRMYTHVMPNVPYEHIFGTTTTSLG